MTDDPVGFIEPAGALRKAAFSNPVSAKSRTLAIATKPASRRPAGQGGSVIGKREFGT